jgi:hypothetical protein
MYKGLFVCLLTKINTSRWSVYGWVCIYVGYWPNIINIRFISFKIE